VQYQHLCPKYSSRHPITHKAIKVVERNPRKGRNLSQALRRAQAARDAGGDAPHVNSTETKIRREIAIMKKCHHENVVKLLEVIDDESNKKIFLSGWNNDQPGTHHSRLAAQFWNICQVESSNGARVLLTYPTYLYLLLPARAEYSGTLFWD
jgi:serine/threonine protein kinase